MARSHWRLVSFTREQHGHSAEASFAHRAATHPGRGPVCPHLRRAPHGWLPPRQASRMHDPTSAPTAWPPAIRSAELLRGTLVRCGPGVRPIGRPESPRQRLAALSPWLEDRIACGATAAWVWGARPTPGAPLRCAMPGRRRPPTVPPPGVVIHQLTLKPDDVETLGGRHITSPLRTAVDLLKSLQYERRDRESVRLLALASGVDRSGLLSEVRRSPRADRVTACARIAEL